MSPQSEAQVGNGRVAIPVAKALGRKLVGLDISPEYADIAVRRIAATELPLFGGDAA